MRKHSWTAVGCLALCLLAAAPARSQSPDPDAVAAARELLTTMKFSDQFKAILPVVLQNLKPAIVQNRPEVERDYDAIVPLILQGMTARLNELGEATAAVYAVNFTAGELRDITAFYRTPTGQRFLQKLPVVTQQSMAIGQRFGQAVTSELQNRITEELRKRGHKI
jgi:uncharacterized protein